MTPKQEITLLNLRMVHENLHRVKRVSRTRVMAIQIGITVSAAIATAILIGLAIL
jgi:hypothetical protein